MSDLKKELRQYFTLKCEQKVKHLINKHNEVSSNKLSFKSVCG